MDALTDILRSVLLPLLFLAPVLGSFIGFRKWPKVTALLLVLYFITYIPLSIAGEYHVLNYGGDDWRKVWCPKYLRYAYKAPSGRVKEDVTVMGALYWPCTTLDRLLVHRTTWNAL